MPFEDLDVVNYAYPFDKPFRGEPPSLQDAVEIMWHMAEGSIRGLLEVANGSVGDTDFRRITVYLAKCWLKDYRELNRRLDEHREANA